MNEIIIITAQILGWLVFVTLALGFLALALALAYRIFRHICGLALMLEALREHAAKHPEKWARNKQEP